MKNLFICCLLGLLTSCTSKPANNKAELNKLAEQYVRLGLSIGEYDGAFIDAYYGPDSLKPSKPKLAVLPKDSLLKAVQTLQTSLKAFEKDMPDSIMMRAAWMNKQLIAFATRIKIISGEEMSFDEESKAEYDAVAPTNTEDHFRSVIKKLDSMLPGNGAVAERFQALANRFIIPTDKLDTVFKTSIAECRKRTLQHYALPSAENFSLEYVTNKPWSGYNWYKGNYQSVIQINTDVKIFIDRAIDVGSHESYPGHHVYNMLLEQNLYRNKGYVEISMYPLFSPQSLIAEGSANYGIELAFPGDEKIKFAGTVLLPLAGLDTTGIYTYFKALELKDQLNYVRNEVARGLINHSMKEEEGMRWLKEYALMNDEMAAKSISFIRAYRSYVINYNYGKDLIKAYIEKNKDKDPWTVFQYLLSNQVTASDLIEK